MNEEDGRGKRKGSEGVTPFSGMYMFTKFPPTSRLFIMANYNYTLLAKVSREKFALDVLNLLIFQTSLNF